MQWQGSIKKMSAQSPSLSLSSSFSSSTWYLAFHVPLLPTLKGHDALMTCLDIEPKSLKFCLDNWIQTQNWHNWWHNWWEYQFEWWFTWVLLSLPYILCLECYTKNYEWIINLFLIGYFFLNRNLNNFFLTLSKLNFVLHSSSFLYLISISILVKYIFRFHLILILKYVFQFKKCFSLKK